MALRQAHEERGDEEEHDEADQLQAGVALQAVHQVQRIGVQGLGLVMGQGLGMQALAEVFGATVSHAPTIMHGKTSPVSHDGSGLFAGLPSPFTATRYHSLTAIPETMPAELRANAWTEDGTIMGLRHVSLPIHGVQFHPESIETQHGHQMLRNFLELARAGGTA